MRLMPLRIPPGWCIAFNKFVELPAAERLTQEQRETYLSEDVMSMMSVSPEEDYWRTEADSLIIDLGWYGPRDSEGFYRLCVLRGSWDDLIISVEDGDQYVIRDCIDEILESVYSGVPVEEISLRLSGKEG